MVPALVLTAGLATRLRPLSLVRAKAALPVAGVNDTITVSLVKEDGADGEISADMVCCEVEAKNPGPTYSLKSVTWKPNACPFTVTP